MNIARLFSIAVKLLMVAILIPSLLYFGLGFWSRELILFGILLPISVICRKPYWKKKAERERAKAESV